MSRRGPGGLASSRPACGRLVSHRRLGYRGLGLCQYVFYPLQRHYWRGLVDGDGCISFYNRRNRQEPSIQLFGTLNIIENFYLWSSQFCNYRALPNKHGTIWRMKISGSFSLPVISALYKDSTVYLDRKMDLAKRALGI